MVSSIFGHITAEKVTSIREVSGMGMMEVRRQLRDEAALAAVGEMEVEDLIDPRLAQVLEYLLTRGAS